MSSVYAVRATLRNLKYAGGGVSFAGAGVVKFIYNLNLWKWSKKDFFKEWFFECTILSLMPYYFSAQTGNKLKFYFNWSRSRLFFTLRGPIKIYPTSQNGINAYPLCPRHINFVPN